MFKLSQGPRVCWLCLCVPVVLPSYLPSPLTDKPLSAVLTQRRHAFGMTTLKLVGVAVLCGARSPACEVACSVWPCGASMFKSSCPFLTLPLTDSPWPRSSPPQACFRHDHPQACWGCCAVRGVHRPARRPVQSGHVAPQCAHTARAVQIAASTRSGIL